MFVLVLFLSLPYVSPVNTTAFLNKKIKILHEREVELVLL